MVRRPGCCQQELWMLYSNWTSTSKHFIWAKGWQWHSTQLGGEFHCHVHCFFKYSMFTKNHFNCSDRAISCLPLALLIPTEEESIPDTSGGNLGTAVLSLCEEKKEKTLTCLFVSFKPLSAIPRQWVQVVLLTDGDRQKKKVLWHAPSPPTQGGLLENCPVLARAWNCLSH